MPTLISFGSSQLLDDDNVQTRPHSGASAGLQGLECGAGKKKLKSRGWGEEELKKNEMGSGEGETTG